LQIKLIVVIERDAIARVLVFIVQHDMPGSNEVES
jgi:hypothetical protein